jgi:hypothetical protein
MNPEPVERAVRPAGAPAARAAVLITTLALAVGAAAIVSRGARAADEAAPETGAPAGATEVVVERERPAKQKPQTLRFLKENRAFIRARFDRLREKAVARRGAAAPIDPRFLTYQELLGAVHAAGDSLAAASSSLDRQELLASINQLGGLEARLDELERLLAEQRARLGILQNNFTSHQRTALIVVLSGHPAASTVSRVLVRLEDAATLEVPLTDDQRRSLAQGGIVQIFHGFVEPRQQVVEVALVGDAWPGGNSGFVTLDPARDRITFLKLDLSGVDATRGAMGMRASTWLHDTRLAGGG